MSINRGSEWRRWDLHFHTQSSYDYKDKSVTNQEIVDILIQEGVDVVVVTDHHIIDVERIEELQKLGKERGLKFFPGIECLSETRSKEPIHLLEVSILIFLCIKGSGLQEDAMNITL
ncbi:MAG: hypothetical protein ACRCV3_03505 [Desulfovibrionaceae bacterium]